MISVGMVSAAARFSWDLKDRVWYWITIAVIVLLHVPIILLIPWPYERWSYIQFLPFALPDFALDYGIIRLVEKIIEGNRKADAQPSGQ